MEHPFRDAWWDDRNLVPLLDRIELPVYIGCDSQNVPLHLPHTFTEYDRLTNSKHLQIAMLGNVASLGRGRVFTSRPLRGSINGSRGRIPAFSTADAFDTSCRRPRNGGPAMLGRFARRCSMRMHFEPTKLLARMKATQVPELI